MIKERSITVTLDTAKELFNSENITFKELALQAFNKTELVNNYKKITTFEEACRVLNLTYDTLHVVVETIAICSKASAAMFKLNIIKKALNLGYNLPLVQDKEKTSCIYYPYNPFITEDSTYYRNNIDTGEMEIIGKIKSKGILYTVIGGATSKGSTSGLGGFIYSAKVGTTSTNIGFLGCATQKIAEHFGKYFGMLITEAKYADMADFEIIYDKYGNS